MLNRLCLNPDCRVEQDYSDTLCRDCYERHTSAKLRYLQSDYAVSSRHEYRKTVKRKQVQRKIRLDAEYE